MNQILFAGDQKARLVNRWRDVRVEDNEPDFGRQPAQLATSLTAGRPANYDPKTD